MLWRRCLPQLQAHGPRVPVPHSAAFMLTFIKTFIKGGAAYLCIQWKQGSFWAAPLVAASPSASPPPSSGNMQMGQSPSGVLAAVM